MQKKQERKSLEGIGEEGGKTILKGLGTAGMVVFFTIIPENGIGDKTPHGPPPVPGYIWGGDMWVKASLYKFPELKPDPETKPEKDDNRKYWQYKLVANHDVDLDPDKEESYDVMESRI